jgi:hypothetical protein
MVILGGAFSIYLLGKERNRRRGTERWVEYERKVKSVNVKKGWSRS